MNRITFVLRLTFVFIILSIGGSKIADLCAAYNSQPFQGEIKWSRYLAPGEEFSVMLPEAPSVATKFRGHIYGAYGAGVVYLITTENNPKQSEKLETFVATFRDRLPSHQTLGHSELLFDREITRNNLPGKRYRINFYGGTKGIVDFYSANERVYIVEAAGGDESNPSIQQFLSSFSLNEKMPERGDTINGAQLIKQTSSAPEPDLSRSLVTEQIFTGKEVDRRPFIVSRPDIYPPEEAGRIRGTVTVVLKVVLSYSGKVTNIVIVKKGKQALTEKAVDAAKKIKFIPAVKDGKFVSQYLQIEQSFSFS
jgi:TonB family protein